YPGRIKGGIWVKLGVIGGENSRKPVLGGFGCWGERNFAKVSNRQNHSAIDRVFAVLGIG
ncbi:hypothetical protein, partial [Neisseria bergeri]